jgi:hypothetical protein
VSDRDPSAPLSVFPFVVGCPRSGTTLLQTMLDCHPDLAVPPESHFIPRLGRRFAEGWHGSARVPRFADALFEGRRFQYWGISREDVVGLLERNQPTDLAAAIRLLYASWAERAGKPAYADKTPRYLTHISRLSKLFEEARFVHLIRDGRDVALSMAEAFERGPQTAAQAAIYWGARVAEGREQGLGLGSGRYLELRYEELVADPEATLRELCEFIDLPFDQAMLAPERRAETIIAGYPDAGVHRNLGRPLERRRDWHRAMPDAERRDFELLAGELLAELRYPVENGAKGATAERQRRTLLASEFEGLRHSLFRAGRKAERRGELLRRQRRTRWARLGASLSRGAARLRGKRKR